MCTGSKSRLYGQENRRGLFHETGPSRSGEVSTHFLCPEPRRRAVRVAGFRASVSGSSRTWNAHPKPVMALCTPRSARIIRSMHASRWGTSLSCLCFETTCCAHPPTATASPSESQCWHVNCLEQHTLTLSRHAKNSKQQLMAQNSVPSYREEVKGASGLLLQCRASLRIKSESELGNTAYTTFYGRRLCTRSLQLLTSSWEECSVVGARRNFASNLATGPGLEQTFLVSKRGKR